MIPPISDPVEKSVAEPASPHPGGRCTDFRIGKTQHAWTVLLVAMVLTGPWFLPSGSTRAPLAASGPMNDTDSVFLENGAGENMTAKTVAAVRATPGSRPLVATVRAGDREGSYIANLVQSIAWPRVVAIRYVGGELPSAWQTEFDAMILCHWGDPPAGARVVKRDLVIVDAGEPAP